MRQLHHISPPTIRVASFPGDTVHVGTLFREYGELLQKNDPSGVDAQFQSLESEIPRLHDFYTPPTGMLFLAHLDHEPVGCFGWMHRANQVCEAKRFYIRPACRRMGIGSALFNITIASARSLGFALMRADTLSYMRAAISIYEKYGFKVVPPYFDSPLPDTIFLELDLTRPIGK